MRKTKWNRIRYFVGALIFFLLCDTTGGAGGPDCRKDSPGSLFSFAERGIDWPGLMMGIAMIESGNDARAYRASEGARGHLQVTEGALKDVNEWAGTNILPRDLHDRETCDFVGLYYLAVILYTNRCAGNIFQAVASWNIGLEKVRAGWYPADYLGEIFQDHLPWFTNGKAVTEERRNHVGKRIVRMIDRRTRKYPRIGEGGMK